MAWAYSLSSLATVWPVVTRSPRRTRISAIFPLAPKFSVALAAVVTLPAAVTVSATVPRPTGVVRSVELALDDDVFVRA